MLKLVKPRHFLPVHGEYAFLCAHAQLALDLGFRNTSVIRNGQMLGVSPMRNGRTLSSGSATVRLCCRLAMRSHRSGKPLCSQPVHLDFCRLLQPYQALPSDSRAPAVSTLDIHCDNPREAAICTRYVNPYEAWHVHLQLSKAQYDAAFGDQARSSENSAGEAAAMQTASAGPDEATGAIIGEVDLEVFYNDGNKVRMGHPHLRMWSSGAYWQV